MNSLFILATNQCRISVFDRAEKKNEKEKGYLKRASRESWSTNSILNKIKDNKKLNLSRWEMMFQPLHRTPLSPPSVPHTNTKTTNYNYKEEVIASNRFKIQISATVFRVRIQRTCEHNRRCTVLAYNEMFVCTNYDYLLMADAVVSFSVFSQSFFPFSVASSVVRQFLFSYGFC